MRNLQIEFFIHVVVTPWTLLMNRKKGILVALVFICILLIFKGPYLLRYYHAAKVESSVSKFEIGMPYLTVRNEILRLESSFTKIVTTSNKLEILSEYDAERSDSREAVFFEVWIFSFNSQGELSNLEKSLNLKTANF